MSDFLYLDYNATTPLSEAARAAMMAAYDLTGNPSSVHRTGRAARYAVERARAEIAALIGLPGAGEVIFTSGGTEANHLALLGAGFARVLVSALEHESVLAACPSATLIPVDQNGRVDLAALDRLLAADPTPGLVSVMAANNETGVIQPMAEIAALAHRHGALVHCDAAQAMGKIPMNMAALGVDFMTLVAHKVGGPAGVGALAIGVSRAPLPQMRGGGQERGWRAGTENRAGIMGFAAALAGAVTDLGAFAGLAPVRDGLEAAVMAAVPAVQVMGYGAARVPNTSCLALPGVEAALQVMAFDLAGIGVSAGSACSSGKVRPSHVLAACGYGPAVSGAAIRISFGLATLNHPGQEAMVQRVVRVYRDLDARTRASRTV